MRLTVLAATVSRHRDKRVPQGATSQGDAAGQTEMTVTEWVNSLTPEQVTRMYDVIDGPIPPEIAAMTDDEVYAELMK